MRWQLDVHNLLFSWGSSPILEQVSCSLAVGEAAVLLGPSGQGKTTLLKNLAGVLSPGGGAIRWSRGPENGSSAQLVAWMPQQDLLLPWKSALRNALFGVPYQQMTLDLESQARRYLTALGLGANLHQMPHELSQGMRQRVALVRTLMMQRPFLLLDEPCSALDPSSRILVLELLKERVEKGECGLLMVSHREDDVSVLQAQKWSLRAGVLSR
jgi:ABC-type nitrate/sulfonate/bicarbonate transport system ATPase subunit